MKKHIKLKTQIGNENLIVRLGKSSNIHQRTEKQATGGFAHDVNNFVSAKVEFGGCSTNPVGSLFHATEHEGDVPSQHPTWVYSLHTWDWNSSVTVKIHEVSE